MCLKSDGRINMHAALSLALFYIGFCQCLLFGQATNDNSSDQVISLSGEAELYAAGPSGRLRLKGLIDIGVLIPETTYELKLKLTNSSESDVAFDQAETGCNCRSIKMDKSKFVSEQVTSGLLTFKTPKNIGSETYYTGIEFKNNRNVVCALSIKGQVAGNLKLKADQLLIKAGAKTITREAEFVFSEPITKNDLTLELDKSLSPLLSVKIKFPNGTPHKGLISVSTVEGHSKQMSKTVIGSISLNDKRLGKQQKLMVVIQKEQPVTLSPDQLDFATDDDNDSNVTANAILRLSSTNFKSTKKATATCSINGQKATVKLKRLANHIYRATITVPKKTLLDNRKQEKSSEASKEFKWSISVDGNRSQLFSTWSLR